MQPTSFDAVAKSLWAQKIPLADHFLTYSLYCNLTHQVTQTNRGSVCSGDTHTTERYVVIQFCCERCAACALPDNDLIAILQAKLGQLFAIHGRHWFGAIFGFL